MNKLRYPIGLLGLLILTTLPATMARALPITFEDLGMAGAGITIPNGYSGLRWQNFRVLDTDWEFANYGPNGFTNGTISGKNVAFNFIGAPASVLSLNGFNISSLAATAGWREDLELTIEAFRRGSLLFSGTYILSLEDPSIITLALTDINELRFTTSGGTPTNLVGSGLQFALEDLNVRLAGAVDPSPVPVPPALTLLLASLIGMAALAKKKRKVTWPKLT